MNMKEAYLKVLGLDQKPLEEAKMPRPSWVPESIKDDQVSDFMGALASAHKEGKETFSFNEKSYKMTVGGKKESTNEEAQIEFDTPKKVKKDEEDSEDDEIVVKDKSKKGDDKDCKEAFVNGREYASHGLMHPDHARREIHAKNGQTIDFYAHGTGDKVSGKVVKNDGKEVHIKGDDGKLHKFKVKADLPKSTNESKYSELTATLSEGGFTAEEIADVIAKLEEAHVGTGGPAAAEAQEMGDNLSDGELDFIDTHEVEVIDGTPEKPDHDKDVDQASAPTAEGAGSVEIDGAKAAEQDAENPVKSKASVPGTKPIAKVEIDGEEAAEETADAAAKKVG